MTFIDPDTGLMITCSTLEYDELRKKFVKTNWTTK